MSGLVEQVSNQLDNLIKEGDYTRAFQLISSIEKTPDFSSSEHIEIQFKKCAVLNGLGRFEERLELANRLSKKCQSLKLFLRSIDAFEIAATSLWRLGKYEAAQKKIQEGMDHLISLSPNFDTSEVKKRRAALNHRKGSIFIFQGELDKALDILLDALKDWEELGLTAESTFTINNVGAVYSMKGELNLALKYYQQSLKIDEGFNNYQGLANTLFNIGEIHRNKGELSEALNNIKESLKLYEQYHSRDTLIPPLRSIGDVYYILGDFNQASKYLERSLALGEEFKINFRTAEILLSLVKLYADKESSQEMEHYLKKLDLLHQVDKNKVIDQAYRLAKAICLKSRRATSSKELSFQALYDILDHYLESQAILRQIEREEVSDQEITVSSIYNLCEFLIVELRTFGNEETLKEVNRLASRLLQIAQNQNSFTLMTKTYLLMSKLAVLDQDVGQATDLLLKAQQIAKEKGYDRLSVLIRQELKKLEEGTTTWIMDQNLSLFDRLNRSNLENIVVSLRQGRVETYMDKAPDKPSFSDFEAFTKQLSQRKFEW